MYCLNYLDLFKPFIYKDEFITLPYRLYSPKIENNKKYPLVVFLHGAGERGNDNIKQITANKGATVWASADVQSENPCFILAPQCPENSWWGSYKKDDFVFEANTILYTVMLLINKISKENPIDENRIYITGLSMGGFGTLILLSDFPEKFAAGVVVCGGGDLDKVSRYKDIPIWLFHAEDDPVVSVDFSRKLFEKSKSIGGNIKYTEYPKGLLPSKKIHPHAAWELAYNDKEMIKWLFNQIKRR
nr:PHB depolymerase family esterase [Thermosipho globiformans]